MESTCAFAAGPAEIHQFGNTTVTFGGPPSAIDARAEPEILLSAKPNLTNTWSTMIATAKPEYGQNLSARVDNDGDTVIEIDCTIKSLGSGEILVQKTGTIKPDAFLYADVKSKEGGLNCEVKIMLKTLNAGETGLATVGVTQW